MKGGRRRGRGNGSQMNEVELPAREAGKKGENKSFEEEEGENKSF